MPTAAVNTWQAANRLDPLYPNPQYSEQNVTLAASTTYLKGQVLGEKTGITAVQGISVTGTPTGGTFTVTYRGATSGAIAYNATAAAAQTAIEAITTVGAGNVAVTGGPLPGTALVVTFRNALGYQPVGAFTTTDSFTGGSSPASAIAATTAGTVGTKGTFGKYLYSNTDGTQVARCVLVYGCTTDANGAVTMTGEWSVTRAYAPVYFKGSFRTQDMAGLDDNAVTNLGAYLSEGTVVNGIIHI